MYKYQRLSATPVEDSVKFPEPGDGFAERGFFQLMEDRPRGLRRGARLKVLRFKNTYMAQHIILARGENFVDQVLLPSVDARLSGVSMKIGSPPTRVRCCYVRPICA